MDRPGYRLLAEKAAQATAEAAAAWEEYARLEAAETAKDEYKTAMRQNYEREVESLRQAMEAAKAQGTPIESWTGGEDLAILASHGLPVPGFAAADPMPPNASTDASLERDPKRKKSEGGSSADDALMEEAEEEEAAMGAQQEEPMEAAGADTSFAMSEHCGVCEDPEASAAEAAGGADTSFALSELCGVCEDSEQQEDPNEAADPNAAAEVDLLDGDDLLEDNEYMIKSIGPPLPSDPNLPGLKRGESVLLAGLVEMVEYNGRAGICVRWWADDGRYGVLLQDCELTIAAMPQNILRAANAAAANASDATADPTASDGGDVDTDEAARLSSLAPVITEEILPDGTMQVSIITSHHKQQHSTSSQHIIASLHSLNLSPPPPSTSHLSPQLLKSPEIILCKQYDEKDLEVLDIRTVDSVHLHNKILWVNVLPLKIKKCISQLISNDMLEWTDVLEDGNLFWEIGYTDKPIWPEPERWQATVCNFLHLLAYEKSVEGRERLYPTARLQIVRDLYFAEWQQRSHELGTKLQPIYFDGVVGEAGPSDGLSAYERKRQRTMLVNQQKLIDLGILSDVNALRQSGKKAKKAPAPKQPKGDPAGPSRTSGRLASQPKLNYKAEKVILDSDDEGGTDEEADDDDDDAVVNESDDEDASGSDLEEEEEGEPAGGSSSAAGKKKKASKPKAKGGGGKKGGKAKAAAEDGVVTKKYVRSRGDKASVAPGGRGFKCPVDNCDTFFDTAAEALAHAVENCGFEGNGRASRNDGGNSRLYDEKGSHAACGTVAAEDEGELQQQGVWRSADLSSVHNHEAGHTRARRQGLCLPAPGLRLCVRRRRQVWDHAEAEHSIERDLGMCLWEDAALGGRRRRYTKHEPTHTGVWPHHCSTCRRAPQECTRPPNTAPPLPHTSDRTLHSCAAQFRQPLLPRPIQVQLRQGVQGRHARRT